MYHRHFRQKRTFFLEWPHQQGEKRQHPSLNPDAEGVARRRNRLLLSLIQIAAVVLSTTFVMLFGNNNNQGY
jgi:hypothetical protein